MPIYDCWWFGKYPPKYDKIKIVGILVLFLVLVGKPPVFSQEMTGFQVDVYTVDFIILKIFIDLYLIECFK